MRKHKEEASARANLAPLRWPVDNSAPGTFGSDDSDSDVYHRYAGPAYLEHTTDPHRPIRISASSGTDTITRATAIDLAHWILDTLRDHPEPRNPNG